ncbi:hypothetical protein ACIPWI_00705 [Streptomyces sp. NPDC090046]|uniref:hypothetical protein n=1 Tax=Streptomyces sp. NPDC090046 TaxID=3365928 RepID=UPI00381233D4
MAEPAWRTRVGDPPIQRVTVTLRRHSDRAAGAFRAIPHRPRRALITSVLVSHLASGETAPPYWVANSAVVAPRGAAAGPVA